MEKSLFKKCYLVTVKQKQIGETIYEPNAIKMFYRDYA